MLSIPWVVRPIARSQRKLPWVNIRTLRYQKARTYIHQFISRTSLVQGLAFSALRPLLLHLL